MSVRRVVSGRTVHQPVGFPGERGGTELTNARVMSRDPKEPANRAKWKTQHDGLVGFDPPYVYHVVRPVFIGVTL